MSDKPYIRFMLWRREAMKQLIAPQRRAVPTARRPCVSATAVGLTLASPDQHPSRLAGREMIYAVLLFLLPGGWALLEHRRLRRYELVCRSAPGPLRSELRRRTYMACTTPGDFPHPLEERVIAWRLWGLPLWTCRSIIGLPHQQDTRIDLVAATEFDRHFGARFRMDAQPLLRFAPVRRRFNAAPTLRP